MAAVYVDYTDNNRSDNVHCMKINSIKLFLEDLSISPIGS